VGRGTGSAALKVNGTREYEHFVREFSGLQIPPEKFV
jgi:hypothetical protein